MCVFKILIMRYDFSGKIGDPLIFENAKMAGLDMDLNELHLHHLYQLSKLNPVMVSFCIFLIFKYNFNRFIFLFIAESVSRMIADLPPKRVTRRLVFETPNGNNQATINSVCIILCIKNYFP